MTAIKALIQRRAVRSYYVLTFVISWGGFLAAGGSGFFAGTNWQSDPRFQLAVLAMLAGPPVASILLTFLVCGGAGVRDLLARACRWRVRARWYAIALLVAPVVQVAVLLTLSLSSREFIPAIATTNDKASVLLLGVAFGLWGGFVEELGWTGFAIPRLWRRYGVLVTGLIVGVLWAAWHLFQMLWVGRSSSATLPLAVFMPLYFLSAVAALTAYRVLMVWVYDRTESLLVVILMHVSLAASTFVILLPPATGTPLIMYYLVLAAALWVIVAAVFMTKRARRR